MVMHLAWHGDVCPTDLLSLTLFVRFYCVFACLPVCLSVVQVLLEKAHVVEKLIL
jgi:hypothetical protein